MRDPQTTRPLGAMAPPGELCVIAATDVMVQRMGGVILFADMQAAIDAYLAEAKKHGWNLK